MRTGAVATFAVTLKRPADPAAARQARTISIIRTIRCGKHGDLGSGAPSRQPISSAFEFHVNCGFSALAPAAAYACYVGSTRGQRSQKRPVGKGAFYEESCTGIGVGCYRTQPGWLLCRQRQGSGPGHHQRLIRQRSGTASLAGRFELSVVRRGVATMSLPQVGGRREFGVMDVHNAVGVAFGEGPWRACLRPF